jgi:uncharacterized membrane protein
MASMLATVTAASAAVQPARCLRAIFALARTSGTLHGRLLLSGGIMSILVLSFLIGVVAGLRTMTAPAAVSWAAYVGWLDLQATPLAFLGYKFTPYIFTVLALFELVSDQLPKTPSRKVPVQFIARILSGGFCGAAIGASAGSLVGGIVAGAIGAIAGTLGGYELRTRLVRAIGGNDLPIALLEDAIAIAGAIWIVAVVA